MRSLRKIVHLPPELIMQGDFDVVRFALTLKTEKWTNSLGLQIVFIEKGEHDNLHRKVRLHDPVTLFICLHYAASLQQIADGKNRS